MALAKPSFRRLFNLDEVSAAVSHTLRQRLYELWHGYATNYSRLKLTRTSDKLVAVQGIVQDVAAFLDDQFVVGF